MYRRNFMKLVAGITVFPFSDIYAAPVGELPNITNHELFADPVMLGPVMRACEECYEKRHDPITTMDREMCYKGMAYAVEHKIEGKHKERSDIALCYYAAAFTIVMFKKTKHDHPEEDKKRVLSIWNDDLAPLKYLKKYHPHRFKRGAKK